MTYNLWVMAMPMGYESQWWILF